MLVFRSSAKLNLTLDVLSRRADGFHDLASVVHTIGLYDTLRFQFGVPMSFRCDVPDLDDAENLCVRAAQAWIETARGRGLRGPCEVAIELEKTVPCGAGLGGGSGNAAAVLLAMSSRYDRNGRIMPPEILDVVAARLGADVPLFLRGGALKMTGIGDRLSPLTPLVGWTVLVQPAGRISTPQAYRAWDESRRRAGRGTEQLLRVWSRGAATHLPIVAARLHNDLSHAAIELGVEIAPIRTALREAGALGSEMTGSGSAVFGLFADQNAAEECKTKLRRIADESNSDWRIWDAPLVTGSVQVQSGARWIDVNRPAPPSQMDNLTI